MKAYAPLQVTSHVARDLLQSAAVFKHEWLVVWEYVSNGLQYIEPATKPEVKILVDSRRKKITISDNGRGMSWEDLRNFFVMHGENIDRKSGRPGRGYFGTGKSAAFGIAGVLRVSTVRDGRRSAVELRRTSIESMQSGEPIPVETLEREKSVGGPNGTTIEIEEIYLRSIDQAQIVKYIERHIARWPHASVSVNGRRCEYTEPPIAKEYKFLPEQEPFLSALAGAELIIKVSKTPLDEDQQGIAIISSGVLYETTLAGSERKEMSQHIFGELNVPTLAADKSRIAAFDLSRSMQLNRSNELVQRILAFIGLHVERVRRELVEEDKRRRATQEAERLAREADEIARIINADFDAFRRRLAKTRSLEVGSKDSLAAVAPGGGDTPVLARGEEVPARIIDETGEIGRGDGRNGDGIEPPTEAQRVEDDESQTEPPQGRVAQGRVKPTPKGGFRVEFRNMGESEARAKYDRDTRTIYINLDHPQVREAGKVLGLENMGFKRLAYEVAFSEYSIALASEMAQAGEFIDFFEPITEVRATLNRVARAASHLYSASL